LYGRFNLLPRDFDFSVGPVIDIGANAGDWTAALLRLVPGADVIAIEPSPELATALQVRFSDDERVRVVAQAISDSVGEVTFHVTAHSHNSSLKEPRNMNREYKVATGWEEVDAIEVPSLTLDALLPDVGAPSLVKIDVQGAEAMVLEGARETLAVARAVLIEMAKRSHYVNDSLADDLDKTIRGLGYGLSGVSDSWLDSETGETLWYDACYLNSRFHS
jgi:FkbM family methyltransferase